MHQLSFEKKKALLKKLLIEKIEKARRPQRFPLSSPQQSIWLWQEANPGKAVYNEFNTLELKGHLGTLYLEEALNALVTRHAILRTRFGTENGAPYQEVLPELRLDLQVVDLAGLADRDLEQVALDLASHFKRHPFSLAQVPLLRVLLLRLSETQAMLLLCQHHIICDAISETLLVEDVCAFYSALLKQETPEMDALQVQYYEWAQAFHEEKTQVHLKSLLKEGLKNLDGAPSLLNFSTDRPRPSRYGFRGKRLPLQWDARLVAGLKETARKGHGSLYMLLLAALASLLARQTHMNDLLIGSPNASRTRKTSRTLGLFANTSVLRLRPGRETTFADLMIQAREQLRLAVQHRDLPFEWLVQEKASRSGAHPPLVQALCVFQNMATSALDLPLLQGRLHLVHNDTAKFDFLLALSEDSNGMTGFIEYNSDIFASRRINQMADQLVHLLNGVLDDLEQPIRLLPLISPEEQARLLVSLNEGLTPSLPEANLVTRFDQYARRNPGGIALIFEETRITYASLNDRASQLAHYLLSQGLQTHQAIPLCTGRTPELIVGVLGILKAGGVYVPIDPAFPKERFRYVLDQCDGSPILTTYALRDRLKVLDHPLWLVEDAPNDLPKTRPDVALSPLAYILFTSGSTGKPKGVMIGHHSVIQLFIGMQKQVHFDEGDTWSLHHAYTFDVSVWEMWAPLLYGGKLVMVSEETHQDFHAFFTLLRRERVTILSVTPAAFLLLAEIAVGHEKLEDLRVVAFAGDVLDTAVLRPWMAHYGSDRPELLNLYGITETTVYITTAKITKAHLDTHGSDIGRPFPGWTAYLLDRDLNPVPEGVLGEIFIGGHGLAYGYVGRAGQTAARFIPNPFSDKPGDRLYASGDLGRLVQATAKTSRLDYAGRLDHQVQIRGFRIEPGEIRNTLLKDDLVRKAVVMVTQDPQGQPELTAFYSGEQELDSTHLKGLLNEHLPKYMHPAHIYHLPKMPLTHNGKVDRTALHQHHASRQNRSGTTKLAPRTPMEKALAGIWAELLKQQKPGLRDNFFDLGGHSLLATRLATRVQARLGMTLPMAEIFTHPTIEEQARYLLKNTPKDPEKRQSMEPITRSAQHPAPLSFSQKRLWFLQRLDPDNTVYNVPFLLHLKGKIDFQAFQSSILWMIQNHASLRTTFSTCGDQPIQFIQDRELSYTYLENPRAFAYHDLSHDPDEADRLIHASYEKPFDLQHGPLFRLQLFKVGPDDYRFAIDMHHIITDGWSTSIFAHEWCHSYAAFHEKREPHAQAFRLDYSDYASWQHEHITDDLIEKDLAYWKEALADMPALIDLPLDRPRPAVQTYNGATRSFALERELYFRLQDLAKSHHQTLFMNLLSAYAVTLHLFTQQEHMVIGTPNANRHSPEVEGIIGFFVTTMVMAMHMRGEDRLLDVVHQAQDQLIGAMAHQHLAFDQLVEHLAPERSLSHAPIFQVMIAMPNLPESQLHAPDLSIEDQDIRRGVAPFDITLDLQETRGTICGGWTYNTDLFEEQTIEAMAKTFVRVLEKMVGESEIRLSQLQMGSPEALRPYLLEATHPSKNNVMETIARAFGNQPLATAVKTPERRTSYKDLMRLVNGYRRLYKNHGLGMGDVVAVYRSTDVHLLAAMLAAFQGGLTYLALDPEGNKTRLSFKLQDTNARLILGEPHLLKKLVDIEVPMIHRFPDPSDEVFDTVNIANIPAYIIYTSGSTGTPKGVVVSHESFNNFNLWWYHILKSHDGLLPIPMITNPIFDANFSQFLTPLTYGNYIWIPKHTPGRNPVGFIEEMSQEPAFILDIVTSVWAFLLETFRNDSELAKAFNLRVLMVGGEALTRETVRETRALFANVIIGNNYGPTEATINTTIGFLAPGDPPHLGDAVANTDLHLVNAYGQDQPRYAPGELSIGGLAVTQGYHKRPGLTAQVFVPDPHSKQAGARRYRSGDKMRLDAEGRLLFLGRTDDQVKLRGLRIEVGEISNVLMQHPAVQQAVVIIHKDRQLVAFYVPTAAAPGDARLKEHLHEHLPQYMVPNLIHELERIPLSPTGKLDRGALVQFHEKHKEPEVLVPPKSSTQKIIADIWKETLKLEQMSIHDSFFELGGHSLLLTKVQSQLKVHFQKTIPVVKLFEYTSIASLAQWLDDGSSAEPHFSDASKQRASSRKQAAKRRRGKRRK